MKIKLKKMSEKWLDNHQDSTWKDLYNSISNNLVRIEESKLIDLYDQKISQLVNDMKDKDSANCHASEDEVSTYE